LKNNQLANANCNGNEDVLSYQVWTLNKCGGNVLFVVKYEKDGAD